MLILFGVFRGKASPKMISALNLWLGKFDAISLFNLGLVWIIICVFLFFDSLSTLNISKLMVLLAFFVQAGFLVYFPFYNEKRVPELEAYAKRFFGTIAVLILTILSLLSALFIWAYAKLHAAALWLLIIPAYFQIKAIVGFFVVIFALKHKLIDPAKYVEKGKTGAHSLVMSLLVIVVSFYLLHIAGWGFTGLVADQGMSKIFVNASITLGIAQFLWALMNRVKTL